MLLTNLHKNINILIKEVNALKEYDKQFVVNATDVPFDNSLYVEGDVLYNKNTVQLSIDAIAAVVDNLMIGDGLNARWDNVVGKPFERIGTGLEVRDNYLVVDDTYFSSIEHTHDEYAPIEHTTNTTNHVTESEKNDISKIGNIEETLNIKYDDVEYDIQNDRLTFKANGEAKKVIDLLIECDGGGGGGDYAPIDHIHEDPLTLPYINSLYPELKTIKDALDKLLYVPLNIQFNSNINNILEIGTVVNEIIFTWQYNKDITSQRIGSTSLEPSIRTYRSVTTFDSQKTFTLTANDGTKEYSKSLTYNFYNSVHFGVSSSKIYNSALLNSLTKKLTPNHNTSFKVDCLEGQHIFYCCPSDYGVPTFTVGGFVGGFDEVTSILYSNQFGHIEKYDIYKSKNPGLGVTNVTVS